MKLVALGRVIVVLAHDDPLYASSCPAVGGPRGENPEEYEVDLAEVLKEYDFHCPSDPSTP
jgi:hypothetical protein